MNTSCKSYKKQKGAALVLSLLILLVMTLIGVTAMQTTTMEERMAGNMNDINIAMQVAEATLRAAEEDVDTLFSTGDFDASGGSDGYRFSQYNAPDPFDSSDTAWGGNFWTNTHSKEYTGINPGNNNYGRYYVELIGETGNTGNVKELTMIGYGETAGGGTVNSFRITARGTGQSGTAAVVLQSYYGKLF